MDRKTKALAIDLLVAKREDPSITYADIERKTGYSRRQLMRIAKKLAEAGVTAADAGMLSVATSMMAVILIVAAAVSILEGVLGIRAANDASKIMPVWILAIIGLVGAVITIIASIANGSFAANAVSNIITLVIDGLMFWIANNIKTEAGK